MEIRTAVIPLGGSGTRTLPAASSTLKGMMSLYVGSEAIPTIDFTVRDCAEAGIERIIFVTSESGKIALHDYFEDIRPDFESQLTRLNKQDIINRERERRRSFNLTFEYITQDPLGPYGTAYPPYLAKDHLKGESNFLLAGGDDFSYNENGTSEVGLAIAEWVEAGTDHYIMGNPIDRAEGPKFGNLLVNRQKQLRGIDEKPQLARVRKHPLANISNYGFNEAIFPFIDEEIARSLRDGQEHFITDVINAALSAGQTFQVHELQGVYMDGGTPQGLLKASNYINNHPRTSK